ncbi:MAG: hypothetical protein IGS03_05045 [Candidatus Sericytochromatia bacterium]|nr:hypothetical protein [Candidatus Sericytochromatia bacterium]
MKIGLIGSDDDGRCQALARFLNSQNAEVVWVHNRSLNQQKAWHFDGRDFYYQGQNLSPVAAWFMATYPPALPEAWTDYQDYYLYRDWYVDYMHKREHRGFFLAWLLSLGHRGVPVMNPPEHAIGMQLKPIELMLAAEEGLRTPRTLISNDPERVREFVASLPEVVFKPSLGGSLCRPVDEAVMQRLDQLRSAPVTFQERIQGTPVRLTLVDGEPVSCVKLLSDHLDYRNDPEYEAGRITYEQLSLPTEVLDACRRTVQRYGMLFSGIDLMHTAEGEYVFLEANCSPLYLDIELRAKDPITAELALALLRHANDPARYQQALAAGRQSRGFVSYAMPFGEDLWT